MFCLECGGEIKSCTAVCPHCGFDNGAYMNEVEETGQVQSSRKRKNKPTIFSEEECLIYGIHPDDEMYRKTMELNVLSKKYK